MKIIVDITRQDYVDFNKFHFMKTGFKKTILTYLIALILMELYLNKDGFNLFATSFSSILFILVCWFLTYNRLNKTKKIPIDDGSFLGETEFDFLEDKILYKKYNSEGNVSWSTIKSFEESKTTYYLYIDRIVAYVIPKRFFTNENEKLAFQELVKKHIKK